MRYIAFTILLCYNTNIEGVNVSMNKINFRLADLRKSKHITQFELADFMGVSFQTISKWENQVTLPDISVLPVLASYFSVSVDELLGLKPLKGEVFVSEETDSETFWDSHLEYILQTKSENWNNDYLKFLVNDVWKINSPVNVLDCGCGNAHLAAILMPLLPDCSTYTGIDFSSSLTEQAKKLIKKNNINGKIIKQNFFERNIHNQFDIVICQSVLRHIGDSKNFIQKMIDAAKENGMVICIDTNREIECCGLYIDGMDYGYLCDHSGAIKHWNAELANKTRDYSAAMRNAYVMRELGLQDIDIRMNDKVSFVCPEDDDYEIKVNHLIDSKSLWYTDHEKAIHTLINHGMTKNEAECYVKKNIDICDYLSSHRGEVSFTLFKGKTISFGYKRSKS